MWSIFIFENLIYYDNATFNRSVVDLSNLFSVGHAKQLPNFKTLYTFVIYPYLSLHCIDHFTKSHYTNPESLSSLPHGKRIEEGRLLRPTGLLQRHAGRRPLVQRFLEFDKILDLRPRQTPLDGVVLHDVRHLLEVLQHAHESGEEPAGPGDAVAVLEVAVEQVAVAPAQRDDAREVGEIGAVARARREERDDGEERGRGAVEGEVLDLAHEVLVLALVLLGARPRRHEELVPLQRAHVRDPTADEAERLSERRD